jgi:RimJ/RimL family protein N-acetyltransferase
MFVGWTQDAEVTRYLSWRPHESVTQAASLVARAIEAWSGKDRAVYVITTREQDVPIGLIEVRFESTFAASVGYVLQRTEWNRRLHD